MGVFSNGITAKGFSKKDMESIRADMAAAKSKGAGAVKGNGKWTITRGPGFKWITTNNPTVTQALNAPKPIDVPQAPVSPATVVSHKMLKSPTPTPGRVFSKSKGKIPHYDSIPDFAKNYERVPARKFIYDLSDSNLERTFGPAVPAHAKHAPGVSNETRLPKNKDALTGLPPVTLPSIAKTEPKPSTINSPQPKVAAAAPSISVAEGNKKILQIGGAFAAGAATGLGAAGAIAYKGMEPRNQSGRRKPTDRRVAQVEHPFGPAIGEVAEQRKVVRRVPGNRRDDENAMVGTKADRGRNPPTPEQINGEYAVKSYGEEGKKDYSGFRAENAAQEERRLKDLGGTKRAGDQPKPRIKLKATETPIETASGPGKLSAAPEKPVEAAAPVVSAEPEAGTLPKSKFIDKRKIYRRQTSTPDTEYGVRQTKGGRRIGDYGRADKPKSIPAPFPSASSLPAMSEAELLNREEKFNKSMAPPASAPLTSEQISTLSPEDKAARIKANEDRIAELSKKAAEPQKPSAPTEPQAPAATPTVVRKRGIPKKIAAPTAEAPAPVTPEATKGFKYRGQPFPKNKGGAGVAGEGVETETVEPSVNQARRAVRRRNMAEKAQTMVGTSQSLTQGIKTVENADRKKALDEYIKQKGVTKVPAAGEETMFPERFAPPVEPGNPNKILKSGKLTSLGTPESPIANAEPIKTKEELVSTVQKAAAKAGPAAPKVIMKSPKISGVKPTPIAESEVVNAATAEAAATKVGGPGALLKRGKLGIAALAGIGAGAFMTGKEAKASTGSYKAAAEAAGKSLYESGREYAKFGMGAAIATRLPGALGIASRFALGKALPALGAAQGAADIYQAGQAGMGAFRAAREAAAEKAGSESKYGTVDLATATRKARQKAKGLL